MIHIEWIKPRGGDTRTSLLGEIFLRFSCTLKNFLGTIRTLGCLLNMNVSIISFNSGRNRMVTLAQWQKCRLFVHRRNLMHHQ